MFFFLIIALVLFGDVAWWLWADAQLRRRRRAFISRAALWTFNSIQLGYLLFFLLLPRWGMMAHHWLPPSVLAGIYIWHVFVLPIAIITIAIFELASWIGRRMRSRGDVKHDALPDDPAPDRLTRREALAAALVAAPPLLLGGTVIRGMSELGNFRIRWLDVPIPDLPPVLDGVTIAHVSDTHVGRFTRPSMLPPMIEATNRLKADFVAFTGDLIDLSISDLSYGIDMIKRLDPRHGIFMVEGNHDLIEAPQEFESECKRIGLPLLLNESVLTQVRGHPVQFLGMTWHRLDAALADSMGVLETQRVHGAFPILLAHHPHAFDPAAAAGIPLTLTGHTHGGQLMLTQHIGAGPAMFRYWSGLYRKPRSSLVVSNGVGNWFPLRINAPAEIAHLTLRRA